MPKTNARRLPSAPPALRSVTGGNDAAWQAFQPESVGISGSQDWSENRLTKHLPWVFEVDTNGQLLLSEGTDFLARSSTVGQSFFQLWHCPHTESTLRQAVFNTINQEGSFEGLAAVFQNPHGTTQHYELSGHAVYQSGQVVAVQGLAENITRLKQAQNQAAFYAQNHVQTGLPHAHNLEPHLRALCTPINQLPWQLIYLKLPTLAECLAENGLRAAENLQTTAVERLKDHCTARDTLTYGGLGQFVWLLKGCTETQAHSRLAACRQALAFPLSADILPTKGQTANQLLAKVLV